MKWVRKNGHYCLFFLLSVILNFIYIVHFYDGPTQYGMAYAIIRGELPYLDFSVVTTPLFPFLHSLFLLIFDSYVTFVIVNSIISTLIFYYAEKIISKRIVTYFLICLFPFCDVICPSYNLLAKLFIMILLYCEKEKKSDYLIGILLGCLFLSKHSVGICVILLSLLYRKNWNGIWERIGGMVLPCSIFLFYLIGTKSLFAFIDLCFLGLLDFSHQNTVPALLFIGLFVAMVLFLLIDIFFGKREDKYLSYYALGSLSFMIPIFDLNHFSCCFLFVLLILFIRKEIPLNYSLFNIFLGICLCFFTYLYLKVSCFVPYVYSFHHFPIYVDGKRAYYEVMEHYGTKYPHSIMIDTRGLLYTIAWDRKFTFFDIPHRGNYGIRGTQFMIDQLEDDTYYYISKYYNQYQNSQLDTELCDYVIAHSELVDSVGAYNVYHYQEVMA